MEEAMIFEQDQLISEAMERRATLPSFIRKRVSDNGEVADILQVTRWLFRVARSR